MPRTAVKRARSESISNAAVPSELDSNTAKKLKLHTAYASDSPFPQYARPTPQEAAEVNALLNPVHLEAIKSEEDRDQTAKLVESPKKNSAETCGNTPNVLDSLIGTILSQNTNSHNSTSAKRSLDAAFGIPTDHSTNSPEHELAFKRIAEAPHAEVMESLRHGGLAKKKATTIQKLLTEVYKRHGSYSLQHLAEGLDVSDADVTGELISYSGVGPKTAACVLLFSLKRPSFAVDTHVFRLSKMLGWVPNSADRIKAQAHLDLRIPPEFKYGLHVGLVRHGRTCPFCKAGASTSPRKTKISNAKRAKASTKDIKVEKEGDVQGENKEVQETKCVLREWLKERRNVKGEHVDVKHDDDLSSLSSCSN